MKPSSFHMPARAWPSPAAADSTSRRPCRWPRTPSSTRSRRAGVDKDFVEDCYLGNCAHGAGNIGRQAALLAGLPMSTAGVSVNRFCSSGLQSIAMAANSIRGDDSECIVAGGVESHLDPRRRRRTIVDKKLLEVIRRSSCR